jgi:REP element-mobilizing transposase RayT
MHFLDFLLFLQYLLVLLPDKIFHIYNHANGADNLFTKEENYDYFLQKVVKHLVPICDIYSYCLLPNHFHLLVRIKLKEEVLTYYSNMLFLDDLNIEERDDIVLKWKKLEDGSDMLDVGLRYQKFLSKQFSNLFSSYTQSFNKVYSRKDSLFLKNFKRKEVTSARYFKNLVRYIHYNAVHHRLVTKVDQWKWSSFHAFVSNSYSIVPRDKVVSYFGTLEQFMSEHDGIWDFSTLIDFD